MDALTALQASDVPMLFVHDEYGHFEGLVTPANLLTALAGAFASDADRETDPPLVEREDGSWWVSGSLPADALAALALSGELTFEKAGRPLTEPDDVRAGVAAALEPALDELARAALLAK